MSFISETINVSHGGKLASEAHKSVLEAALFAAGRILTIRELSELLDISEEQVRILADELAQEYSNRDGGIEIMGFGEGYSMQVRPDLTQKVVTIAPKELEAPLVRTLAVIAYKQPIKQSDLAAIRGNKCYAHIKELEHMGLISSVKDGHTKILTTTKAFADYFGLASEGPESVKKAIKKEKLLGVSPMYASLASRLDLDYVVVNPYSSEKEDREKLRELDLLVIASGYTEKVRKYYSGEIIEAKLSTLSDLKESANRICQALDKGNIRPLADEIDMLVSQYRAKAKTSKPVKPLTSLAEEIARDLIIPVQDNGQPVATDCSGLEAKIILPTHQQYDMDIVERIKQRYDMMLSVEMIASSQLDRTSI